MHERLRPLILTLARELAEAVTSGEHPAAALAAALDCTGAVCCSPVPGEHDELYPRLSSIRGGIERAASVYAADAGHAAVILRGEAARLEPLAELARAAELCEAM